jgi:alanine dehydrogenase
MLIGIPKEIKDQEFRVGATPYTVKALIDAGHKVLVQSNAGDRIGFSDEMYEKFGAKIVKSAKEIYDSEMIYKVKEPQAEEFPLLKEGQILFCYLHLAPDPIQTKALLEKKVIGIAFETVTDPRGKLPLLVPMSEVAGRIAVQAGAYALQMINGGKGVLLGGIPGVSKGRVLVLGGGVVGTEALRMALGLGAEVKVFDNNLARLRELDLLYSPALKTGYPTPAALSEAVANADLVIGAVLVPGKKAPHLITREMVKRMEKGSVIVDVAIDQGGCVETSRPTKHSSPIFIEEGVVHYCVTNMPAACAKTATEGLCNSTLPFALQIANLGVKKALTQDSHLLNGLNVYLGKVTNKPVAEDLGYLYVSPKELLQ